MEEINDLVFRINTKVEKLVLAYTSVKDENEELKTILKEHLLTIDNQKKIIDDLKKERSNLVLAQLVKQAEGKSDVKKRIDEMVREIDRCIGLLNK